MKGTVRKGILAGVGLVDLSMEMARGAIDVLVKTGEMTAEQGKKAVDKLQERGEKDIHELRKKLDEAVGGTPGEAEAVGYVTKLHFDALEARVARIEVLERRVAELERLVDEITEREGPAA
jgi:polyhydroxyalkanoate synthesis regulator phasin